MTTTQIDSPVQLVAADAARPADPDPELEELYRGFEKELLVPLWTEIGDLMPAHPQSKAPPHLWRWDALLPLAERAGQLVPVGRGGERRAIALANPSLGGRPFAAADAVGRDPVPHARRGRPRAPPHPARLPLRRRGRGRLDRRGPRPGRDAPRRLPAAGGLELARAPQRHRASRWPGSTGWTSRSSTATRPSSSSSAAT